jgi:LPS export ABC transporter permease LptG/LPS export ABC transporter permease LptF
MKILHRYLRREIALYAGIGLLVFTFVVFMQDLGRAMEAAVRADGGAIAQLFVYVLPAALVFTLPMAILVGLLLGLGRLGVDSELLALRASGVGARQCLRPLLEVTGLGLGLALALTLWLAPAARRQLTQLTRRLAASQLSAAVEPRVFFEPDNNPNWVVYTGDILGDGSQWEHVLVAQMQDPTAPVLTLAESGTLVRRGERGVQLHLLGGTQYKVDGAQPQNAMVSSFQSVDIPFLLPEARAGDPALAAEGLAGLWRRSRSGSEWRAARVELYRRLALGFACLALALVGIALGLRGGRGGKAGGFVLTLGLVLGYYLLFILGLSLAKQGKLPPFWGAWGANLIFIGWGTWALWRLDRAPFRTREKMRSWWPWRRPAEWSPHLLPRRRGVVPRGWMPSLLGGYAIREFLAYTGLLLAAFLVLILVFTLFELMGSILQNHVGVGVVLEYLFYFTPQMLYMTVPVAILVGTLIAFGLMSKANEVTAMKASGVSIYKLLLPVLVVAGALCALQFALDATWLPAFNQRQDALHDRIKGQPPQTYTNPQRKWVMGRGSNIFYYTYFDPQSQVFANLSVFQLDGSGFALRRRIYARQARWDPGLPGWVFSNGWARTFSGPASSSFESFVVSSFSDIEERPSYFATDTRLGTQMTFSELRQYVATMRHSGYDVSRLNITLNKKIAYPLITVIMALLAFPFALTVGRRGTVAGITAGVAVAIAYWSAASLLEALGNLNQLPAAVAAWAPDALFLGVGVYLLLRVPT